MPWLYDVELMLHTEAAQFCAAAADEAYVLTLLQLAADLPLGLLSLQQLQRLELHAAKTARACEADARTAVAAAAQKAEQAVVAARKAAEEAVGDEETIAQDQDGAEAEVCFTDLPVVSFHWGEALAFLHETKHGLTCSLHIMLCTMWQTIGLKLQADAMAADLKRLVLFTNTAPTSPTDVRPKSASGRAKRSKGSAAGKQSNGGSGTKAKRATNTGSDSEAEASGESDSDASDGDPGPARGRSNVSNVSNRSSARSSGAARPTRGTSGASALSEIGNTPPAPQQKVSGLKAVQAPSAGAGRRRVQDMVLALEQMDVNQAL